jgi:nucleotide-binding universal stress UspA family protein
MKILLAVDGSECGNAAVESVATRPWPAGSEVKIISAIELPFVPTPETWALPDSYYTQLETASKENADKAVQTAADRLLQNKEAQLVISTEVKSGRARDVILDEAEAWGADLIVLGSHGYSGWQRFLLGSVSHAVATHAHCSVEVVRARKQ